MMRRITIVLLVCLMIFSGCTQAAYVTVTAEPIATPAATTAQILTPATTRPTAEPTVSSTPLDWDMLIDSTKDDLTDPAPYGYVKRIDISVDEQDKQITIFAVLDNSKGTTGAVAFANAAIKQLGKNVSASNSTYNPPSPDDYGSIFDEYALSISVASVDAKEDNQEEWYINQNIARGAHSKIAVQSGYVAPNKTTAPKEETASDKKAEAKTQNPSKSDEGATSSATIYVWKTATGKRYHRINNCGNTNPANTTQITIERAKALGLGPCGNCNPPR